MEEEKRLIDANDLWSDIMMLPHNGDMISSEEVEQAIKDAPTVDAVEVVRCGECRFYQVAQSSLIGEVMCCVGQGDMRIQKEPDDFCSYGERRTDHV